MEFNQIFILSSNPCRLGEIASRNFVVERLRQKCCLSEASLFLSSENDKILADLSAAASFFCFSFLREKRERKFLCRTYGTLISLWSCLQAFRATLSIPAYNLSSLTGLFWDESWKLKINFPFSVFNFQLNFLCVPLRLCERK